MPITAKELAKKLGISPATVSMAFNNKPGISPVTRQRILEAAQEYGYPAGGKSSLSMASMDTICFVIYKRSEGFVTDTPFFSLLSEGIDHVCVKNQYHFSIRYLDENRDLESQLQDINSACYSGIILLATRMTDESLEAFRILDCPIVLLDAYLETVDYPCVTINNAQGAYMATNYLIAKRKEHPGYLMSSVRISNFDERTDGFYRALRKHHLTADDTIVHELTPVEESAYQEMSEIIASGTPLANCYFADNDHIAIGAMKALQDHGYRIPEDIGIVGFDDLPLSQYLNPPLTTISVPQKYMGEAASLRLIEMIQDNDRMTTKLSIGTRLEIRGSV